jgi:hypothetical protein
MHEHFTASLLVLLKYSEHAGLFVCCIFFACVLCTIVGPMMLLTNVEMLAQAPNLRLVLEAVHGCYRASMGY